MQIGMYIVLRSNRPVPTSCQRALFRRRIITVDQAGLANNGVISKVLTISATNSNGVISKALTISATNSANTTLVIQ